MNETRAVQTIRSFGLERVLSDEDDVLLWGQVLTKYWGSPGKKNLRRSALYFDIGKVDAQRGTKMIPIEHWEIEIGANDRFAAIPRPNDVSEGSLAHEGEIIRSYAQITIERPSKGRASVLVSSALVGAPLLGHGATHRWASTRPWLLWLGKKRKWRESWLPLDGWRS